MKHHTTTQTKLKNDTDHYELTSLPYQDSGGGSNLIVDPVTNGEHYVEVRAIRSTGVGDNNGSYTVWYDGGQVISNTGQDNWDIFAAMSGLYVGVQFADANTAGTFYIDEIKANDDGSEIGALGGSDSGPEFTPTSLLLAIMGSLGVYFFFQRNWRLAEEKKRVIE